MKTQIHTKTKLAERLEISIPTVTKYLSLPGAPRKGAGGWDLAAVAEFIAARAESLETSAKTSGEIGKLRAKELSLKCDRLKFRLEVERGQWVKKTEVARVMASIMGPADAILEAKLVNEYPSAVAGLDVPQSRVYGRRLAEEIRDQFRKLGDAFAVLDNPPTSEAAPLTTTPKQP